MSLAIARCPLGSELGLGENCPEHDKHGLISIATSGLSHFAHLPTIPATVNFHMFLNAGARHTAVSLLPPFLPRGLSFLSGPFGKLMLILQAPQGCLYKHLPDQLKQNQCLWEVIREVVPS